MNKDEFHNDQMACVPVERTVRRFVHMDWVVGARITESVLQNGNRRFTATIRGWRNWKLGEHMPGDETAKEIQVRVRAIRDRIDAGDESVFGA